MRPLPLVLVVLSGAVPHLLVILSGAQSKDLGGAAPHTFGSPTG